MARYLHAPALRPLALSGPAFWLALALIFSSLSLASAEASEIVVKNDSIPPTGINLIGTEVGERFAARLTSPIDGNLVGVQLVWGSINGSASPSQEAAIRISAADGDFFSSDPSVREPGTVLATVVAPTLLDVGLNEFRYLDPNTNLLPLNVPVAAGEDYYVDLELANIYAESADSPGLFFDAGPLLGMRSFVMAPSVALFGWIPTEIPIVGAENLGIRAIIQPVPEPTSLVLMLLGGIGLCFATKRAQR